MRLFEYTVEFRPGAMGATVIKGGMVQVEPDVWSEEHIAKLILSKVFGDDPRFSNVVVRQIPILG